MEADKIYKYWISKFSVFYNVHCKLINYSLRNWVKQEMGQIRREDIFADALTPLNILYKDLNAKFFKKQLSPPSQIPT